MSIATNTEQLTMTSREIAEMYDKPHNDVLKKIRKLEKAYIQVFGNEGSFSLVEYRDAKGEMRPEIHLNKSQALFIASRFDATLHAKVQKRWEDLENQNFLPPVIDGNFMIQLGQQMKEKDQKILLLTEKNQTQQKQIEIIKPKAQFADAISTSSKSIKVGEYAKVISNQSGFVIGQKNLFKWLRYERILDNSNAPYQRYINNGWFEIKESTYENKNTNGPQVCFTTMVTGMGQVSLLEKFRKSKYSRKFLNKDSRANINGGFALFGKEGTA